MKKIIDEIIENNPIMISIDIRKNSISIGQDIENINITKAITYHKMPSNNLIAKLIAEISNIGYIVYNKMEKTNNSGIQEQEHYGFLRKDGLEDYIDLDNCKLLSNSIIVALSLKNGDYIFIDLDTDEYKNVLPYISNILMRILVNEYNHTTKLIEKTEDELASYRKSLNDIQDIAKMFSKEDQLKFELSKDK